MTLTSIGRPPPCAQTSPGPPGQKLRPPAFPAIGLPWGVAPLATRVSALFTPPLYEALAQK
ncbi:hypothetical protein [Thiomonas sp. X19]|uniref:hypothetical protein n=1 Tax=Thiomonas sp. X19 TaxID=1050370 RepID=UPI0011BE599D|nr:hypothetical protein [Thiomonas sp. X19]